MVTFTSKLGQGLEGKVKVLGVGIELGYSQYFEGNLIKDQKYTMEFKTQIQITNQISLGWEAKSSMNPGTGQLIPEAKQGFLGLQIGKLKLGLGDIPTSSDIIGETTVGVMTPFGGWEGDIGLNLSEVYRRHPQPFGVRSSSLGEILRR